MNTIQVIIISIPFACASTSHAEQKHDPLKLNSSKSKISQSYNSKLSTHKSKIGFYNIRNFSPNSKKSSPNNIKKVGTKQTKRPLTGSNNIQIIYINGTQKRSLTNNSSLKKSNNITKLNTTPKSSRQINGAGLIKSNTISKIGHTWQKRPVSGYSSAFNRNYIEKLTGTTYFSKRQVSGSSMKTSNNIKSVEPGAEKRTIKSGKNFSSNKIRKYK